jgi:hypothetical protein
MVIPMMVLSPASRNQVVELAQRLLQQRLLNEKDIYQLFLFSTDSFQKELAINIWQAHVEDASELENLVKRYGGSLTPRTSFSPFTGYPEQPLQDHIHKALEETGEALSFYEDALKRQWPVDIRMLLQKHRLRCKDILRRLEAAFLPQQHAAV